MAAEPVTEFDTSILLARAAVRGTFDPVALLGEGDAADQDKLAFLARRAAERKVGDRWLWTLTPLARREGLGTLPGGKAERRRFLDDNVADDDDVFGQMLQAALRSRRDARNALQGQAGSAMEAERQVAFLQAMQALLEAGIMLPVWVNDGSLRAARRTVALTTRRQAARALLPDAFRGRGKERRFLGEYAATGLAAIEAARARPFEGLKFSEVRGPANGFPALGLGGIGGSGKSALLAVVRKSLARRRDLTLVAFDFDQPQLRVGDIGAMSLDFSRQLGLIEPALEAALAADRDLFRQRTTRAGTSGGQVEKSSTALIEFCTTLAGLLRQTGRLSKPLVLVMDTFEELLVVSLARIELLSDWLALLRLVGFTDIRLILSGRAVEAIGRAPPTEIDFAAWIELGDLGPQAGRAKLHDVFRRYDIPHADLVPRAVATFGSNPLVLEILARFCRDKSWQDVVDLIEQGEREAASGLQGEFAQRFLYSRILERIADTQVRELASPGLVLRRVTVALVRNVLVGRCSLAPCLSEDEARVILQKLAAQVWLVDPVGEDEVVHRRDLRRLMLPQLLLNDQSVDIARAAADWFGTESEEPAAWLEALYYRALAGDDLAEIERAPLRALSDHLGGDVDDLPLPVRARVREAAGRRLNEAEVEALPADDRARILKRRRRTLVAEGLESVALETAANEDSAGGATAETPPTADPPRPLPPSPSHALEPAAVEAEFNTCRFGQVAELLNTAFRGAVEDLVGRRPMEHLYLNHPAYLAVISACLHRDEARSQMAALLDWIRTERSPNRQDSSTLLASAQLATRQHVRAALDGEGRLVPVLLAIRAAGFDPWPLFGSYRGPDDIPFAPPAASTTAFRVEMALRHLRSSPVEVKAAVLPIFDTSLLTTLLRAQAQPLGTTPLRFGVGEEQKPFLEAIRPYLDETERKMRNIDIATINRLDDMALDASVVISAEAVSLEEWPLVAVGRVPELYAPARSALMAIDTGKLMDAIYLLGAENAFWPIDLDVSAFLQPSSSRRLIASLVEIADRCGSFETLLKAVAPHSPQAADVLSVYHGLRAAWASPPMPFPGASPMPSSAA